MSEDIEAVFNNGCPTLTDKFSRWSPPPPVFAYLATEQEPDLSPNERAKALRALGSAHCIIDRRTRKPEV